MIQFNLLPDIKLEYIRAKNTKRTVMLISAFVSSFALFIFVLLFIAVGIVQKSTMRNLSAEITKSKNDLQQTPGLSKILTVQNQINSLSEVHQQKPAITRLAGFIKQVTPAQATISKLNVDYTTQIITITGSADSLETVNKYADTLKFTQFTNDGKTANAFSEVVLSNFGKTDKATNYTITFKFDAVLFDNSKTVSLVVPKNKITTRSEQEKPNLLFKEPNTQNGAQ